MHLLIRQFAGKYYDYIHLRCSFHVSQSKRNCLKKILIDCDIVHLIEYAENYQIVYFKWVSLCELYLNKTGISKCLVILAAK